MEPGGCLESGEGSQTQDFLETAPTVTDPSADGVTQEANPQMEEMPIISGEGGVAPNEIEKQNWSSAPASPEEMADVAEATKGLPSQQQEDAMDASLNSMFHTIASSKAQIKSQQKDEPDLVYDQKLDIIKDLFWCKPVVFLERFHKIIKEEHLICFNHLAGNYEATFYCNEIRKSSMKKSARTNVRNKRYAALQQLIKGDVYDNPESKAEDWVPSDDERTMLREEFVSRMYARFLDGEDRDFDYSAVDDNPDFDNLDIVSRDAEERYFDEEEPLEAEDMEMDRE
ncbi:coiled-coil domain-containing protein 97 [Mustelus asterias]